MRWGASTGIEFHAIFSTWSGQNSLPKFLDDAYKKLVFNGRNSSPNREQSQSGPVCFQAGIPLLYKLRKRPDGQLLDGSNSQQTHQRTKELIRRSGRPFFWGIFPLLTHTTKNMPLKPPGLKLDMKYTTILMTYLMEIKLFWGQFLVLWRSGNYVQLIDQFLTQQTGFCEYWVVF